jgi:hypothetical protein
VKYGANGSSVRTIRPRRTEWPQPPDGIRGVQRTWTWLHPVISKDGPPEPLTRLVLLAMAMRMNDDGTCCFAGVRHLAQLTGLNKDTVARYRLKAVGHGFLIPPASCPSVARQEWLPCLPPLVPPVSDDARRDSTPTVRSQGPGCPTDSDLPTQHKRKFKRQGPKISDKCARKAYSIIKEYVAFGFAATFSTPKPTRDTALKRETERLTPAPHGRKRRKLARTAGRSRTCAKYAPKSKRPGPSRLFYVKTAVRRAMENPKIDVRKKATSLNGGGTIWASLPFAVPRPDRKYQLGS